MADVTDRIGNATRQRHEQLVTQAMELIAQVARAQFSSGDMAREIEPMRPLRPMRPVGGSIPNCTDDLFAVTELLQMFAEGIGVERRTVEDWRYTAQHRPTREGTTDLGTVWLAAITMLIQSLRRERAGGGEVARARRLQAQRHIEANLSDPRLGPDKIAAALHMSRRSLYRLLASDEGGVAAYVRRQRLHRARTLLADPAQRHRSIADIAAAVGLPSGAHFSRLFRARYGEAPRHFRARA